MGTGITTTTEDLTPDMKIKTVLVQLRLRKVK